MTHNTLLQNVTLFSPGHPSHNCVVEILIQDGVIAAMGEGLGLSASELIDGQGAYVSLGWMDPFGVCPDPGEPWKETLQSYSDAAQKGGFTQVAALCGSNPKPDNESVISQAKNMGRLLPAEVLPLGYSSVGGEGKEMAEMYEMHQAGALAFTDGITGSASLSLRTKLMQYAHSLGLNYIHFPYQKALAPDGKIHEGLVNATLGFKGIPAVSETVELLADIELAKYLKTPLRILGVSAAESVDVIRRAKADGVEIYASVPVLNLLYTDEAMLDFDENLKVLPPLRSESDRKALILGLLDGTLTSVMSNHHPEDIENKKLEFDYAAWGAATLVQTFAIMCKAFQYERPELWVPLLYKGNRQFMGVPVETIGEGIEANLTLFTLTGEFALINERNPSKAYNVPRKSDVLQGKVLGTIRKGCFMKNHD
ncbi:MAG: dihydroorotase [Bacteroidetes bacterium]|jgi:dihydroorotase|nr:dihydroorotase [Bacteroidota bacterium]